MEQPAPRRLIVAITGATGTIYGVRVLELLRDRGIETHLIVSRWGGRTLLHETNYSLEDVRRLATHVHQVNDQGAPLSSGSFITDGMIIVPCSMRSLGAIANGLADDLIHRAADVVLKERRKLVLAVRESPLNDIHLENMLKLSRMGVVICPPMPSFYTRPGTIQDLVDYSAVRLLDQFGIHMNATTRWDGKMTAGARNAIEDNDS
jgi:4-hydroxy-3-polyprenylbenzoate decarboxylase